MKTPKDTMQARLKFYESIDAGLLGITQIVKSMRKLIGKTQPEFAKLTGISLPALREIEQGRGNPTIETLHKLGKPFGLEPAFRRRR